jgi:hypothetical protein
MARAEPLIISEQKVQRLAQQLIERLSGQGVLPTSLPPLPFVRIEVDFSGPDAPDFRAFLGGVPDGMSPADFADGCAEALTQMATDWRSAEESEG